jgi:hypothetical protein
MQQQQQQQQQQIAIIDDDDECLVVAHYTGQEVLARRQRRHSAQAAQATQQQQQQQHELADANARLALTIAELDALKTERTATLRRHEETNVERDTHIEDLTNALAHERAQHEEARADNRRHDEQHARCADQRAALTRQRDELQRNFDLAQIHVEQNEHMGCSVCLTLYVELSLTSK